MKEILGFKIFYDELEFIQWQKVNNYTIKFIVPVNLTNQSTNADMCYNTYGICVTYIMETI